MESKSRRNADVITHQRILIEDYSRFRRLLAEKNIAVNRLDWQPYVMLEKYWNREDLFDLFNQLKKHSDPNTNLALELFDFDKYRKDIRYTKKLFAEIEGLDTDSCIYVFFPRHYNSASCTMDLKSLDLPVKMLNETREKIMREVQNIFGHYWPDYYMKFIPFGSQMYGLGFPNSPLNICIEMDEPDLNGLTNSINPIRDHVDEPYCNSTAMNIFHRNGGEKFHFSPDINSIRMKLNTFNIEYNFNKGIFSESTNLIQHYLTLDPRVEPFLYSIKVFGRGRNIFASQIPNGVRYYGYVIMALSYLAQLDPPVIPNLQHINQQRFDDDCFVSSCRTKRKYWDTAIKGTEQVGVAARYHDCVYYDSTQPKTSYFVQQNPANGRLYWNSKNESTLGELFIDFFYYYGYEFDYRMFAVSLKFGGRTALKSDWKKDEVAIEDPFMAKMNIASNTDGKKFQDIFKGSFSVLHSGICFETLHKKVSDIVKFDSPRGINNDRPLYSPMKRWKIPATSKSFLLIGLPKTDVLHCYCTRITNLFSTHGRITHMLDLDGSTKQIFFTADTGNAMDIVLPSTFTLDGRVVHLVELYDYTFSDSA